jgi:hypothetical protein
MAEIARQIVSADFAAMLHSRTIDGFRYFSIKQYWVLRFIADASQPSIQKTAG